MLCTALYVSVQVAKSVFFCLLHSCIVTRLDHVGVDSWSSGKTDLTEHALLR